MAGSLNKVMLIGNLGADPEVRQAGQSQVANFRMACTESWTDQSGQKQERTEWITIVAWRKQAEIAQRFLRKGSRVYVEGKLQTRSWEDKNGGGKRYATEVLCDRFMMMDGRSSGHGGGSAGGHGGEPDFEGGARAYGGAREHGGVMDLGETRPSEPSGGWGPQSGSGDDDLPF